MQEFGGQLRTLNQFIQKSDGRDKLCASIQYACMLIAAGEPGKLTKIQKSVASARKVFRILRPLEVITPVLLQPGFKSDKSAILQIIGKLKAIFMAIYFGFDHVIWAHQAGLVQDKSFVERCQKISLWNWFCGSLCTICLEVLDLIKLHKAQLEREETKLTGNDNDEGSKVETHYRQLQQHYLKLIHAISQAFLALGLAKALPFRPRQVASFGLVASLLNCYMLYPSKKSIQTPKILYLQQLGKKD
eukprot:TRINITY_DN8268_c0_g1_i4.p1 TRINITY_DN8268_c0_g1~~TRINITY_DN8268_c0_g1_i4.p1  ORF type:complete len:259 (-),score=30.05 TRINITY_DN8268_c0_g1_i4:260-997(-)